MKNALSPRETEIVKLAGLGWPDLLDCSPHTIKEHWRRAFRKLGVHSRAMAVMRLLSPEQATRHGEDFVENYSL
jgi:DNA-binding NarL/FixJ family response regulator